MDYIKKQHIADMTGIAVRNQSTLDAGRYYGTFVGVLVDAGGMQWISLAAPSGTHLEQNDMDVSAFQPMDKVRFNIESKDGAGLVIKGSKFRLYEPSTKKYHTEWTDMLSIYKYIRDNNITLAGPRLVSIEKVD